MKITDFKSLSKEFRKKMIDLEMTNKELSEKIGISQSAVSQFLKGGRNLNMSRVFEICSILEFDLEVNHKIN